MEEKIRKMRMQDKDKEIDDMEEQIRKMVRKMMIWKKG
jgi:hypothetical protein